MPLQGLIEAIRQSPEYRGLVNQLEQISSATSPDETPALCILRASRGAILSGLQIDWPGPILVVSASPQRARALAEEVTYLGHYHAPAHYFHAPDALFYDSTPWDPITSQSRASVLSALTSTRKLAPGTLITASVWAMMSLTASRLAFRRAPVKLSKGQQISQYELLKHCVKLGYEPSVVVEQRGCFGHRGSIVDIFCPAEDNPIRIDFFGDEIDSIRTFSASSQRSLETLNQVLMTPTVEALPEWGPAASQALASIDLSTCDAETRQRIQDHIERLSAGQIFNGIEYYMPYLYPRSSCIMDYLPRGTLVLLDDAQAVQAEASHLQDQAVKLRAELIAAGRLPADWAQPYLDWDAVIGRFAHASVADLAYDGMNDAAPEKRFFVPSPLYSGQFETAIEELVDRKDQGERIVLVSRQAERLADLLGDHNTLVIPVHDVEEPPAPGKITLVDGIMDSGWMLPSQKLMVLSDAELFGWLRVQRKRKSRREFAPESRFFEFKPGDYVVHVDHGIGQYNGIMQKSIGTVTREYIEIIYADDDKLYVPIQQADQVTRYVGADERSPRMHRLGGTEWQTVRARAERAVRELAIDLLELYAARQVLTGHAYSPDNAWQRELEASFPYEETVDQLRALGEVKADMETARPMDRLLCGDVGYGKTEVALRAVFKAAMDGKQVAILVPTTVLAQQHYYTFRRRLRAFPVTVEMLSRFRKPQEQERTIRGLVNGTVDVVIGTHRLLSKDVSFKDLGLVVIDEEQRFGVQHKETLTSLRRQVDVLTMTATPIPRTLSLALSGARDMSMINTPPEERLPVRTSVAKMDWSQVRKAILREIDRGGQIYFVHNRVHDISSIAEKLREVVPEASLIIGHGQMGEGELAQVMLGFARGESDILLCTTIIESGLDIPNTNTIIIDRADTFGLAQLYQLRGRVGRGTNRGYAYLFYKSPLSEIARQRLETIQEATELGSGYQVAMRDLEIRGAGDILGAEQHGHIAAVGFDLYTKLLRQAVDNLRETGGDLRQAAKQAQHTIAAEQLVAPEHTSIDLPVSTYIPESFIADDKLRLRLYRRMAEISTIEQVDELREELQDRFGKLVEPVEGLVLALRIRVLADEAGVLAIRSERQTLVLMLPLPLTDRAARALTKRMTGTSARGTRVELAMSNDWKARLPKLLELLASLELAYTN